MRRFSVFAALPPNAVSYELSGVQSITNCRTMPVKDNFRIYPEKQSGALHR